MSISFLRKKYNGAKRKIWRALKLHPVSTPYLSGDTFRALAQHIEDMDAHIDPAAVRENDIVFVQSLRIKSFFDTIHPRITAPYILITHNADENITEEHAALLDHKVRHWFAQNCLTTHEKITPLPIGLENKWYFLHGIPSYFDTLRKTKVEKVFQILYKFNVATNPKERGAAMAVLEKHPLATTYSDWRESWRYLTTLQHYAYVASPVGNGADCHRTWEAMYLGTIPIVTRSPMTTHFKQLGLPLVLIDSWSDIERFDEAALRKMYAELLAAPPAPALFAPYWIDLILSKRTQV